MSIWIFPIVSFGLAVLLTPLVMRLAAWWRVVDDPAAAPDRKRHQRPTALLGGWAIILSVIATWWLIEGGSDVTGTRLPFKQLVGLTVAGLAILLGGWLDDRRGLSPRQQLIAPLVAVLATVGSGIGIEQINNPFGGVIPLDTVYLPVFTWHGVTHGISLWADVFAAIWLLLAMYATKLLDGLDGLVTGVGVIGSIVVFLLTLRPEVHQPAVGAMALTFGAACVAFLFFNWHPAKIFLGESGSLFVGFILGVLAIISGGKLATALLILGLPLVDLVFVVLYRWLVLHRSPLRSADRSHLHFRLVDQGWSVRRTVLFLYAVTAVFGFATLIVRGPLKILTVLGLALLTVGLALDGVRRAKKTPL